MTASGTPEAHRFSRSPEGGARWRALAGGLRPTLEQLGPTDSSCEERQICRDFSQNIVLVPMEGGTTRRSRADG